MRNRRPLAVATLLQAVPAWLAFALAALLGLAACVPEDRLAGTSTEAGNAGGKLSLSGGGPAAGVSVALVARTFVPDTSGVRDGDRAGQYYRTRTDGDGRFLLKGVAPGTYRVMAVGAEGGVMADSVVIGDGPDTALIEETLKPLGGLRGVAKLVGTGKLVKVWVRPVATLKTPPVADSAGSFRMDSLPEGRYELLPQCFGCVPADTSYRVWVKAGQDTLMADTLKVYPDYFLGFPAPGDLEVLAGELPAAIAGKPSAGEDDAVRPLAVRWTWNGAPVPGRDVWSGGRVSETGIVLDSALLAGASEGSVSVTLVFPDTAVTRAWTVRIAPAAPPLPMLAVEADSAFPVRGLSPVARWRFRVSGARRVEPGDVAFWGLSAAARAGGEGSPEPPAWVSLAVAGPESAMVAGRGPQPLTFLLVPDSVYGGRVFRARRDERLADFANIRLLDRGRLGFADPVSPSMRPDGLVLDRRRAGGMSQRYRVDLAGGVTEVLGALIPPGGAAVDAPLLFWRTAGSGFAWDRPAQGADRSLAVTRDGRAYRLDPAPGAGAEAEAERGPVDLPPGELAALDSLLGALAQDPPGRPDTASVPPGASSEYLYYGSRGLLLPAGRDTLLAAFRAWLRRNRLDGTAPAFPLGEAVWRFAGFERDSAYRETGDTLVLTLTPSGTGAEVREGFSPGSVSRLHGGAGEAVYRLFQDGDTLVAQAAGTIATSLLFGDIGARRALFAVASLRAVPATLVDGLPVLDGGGNVLSGRLEGDLAGWGRVLASPGIHLDGRGIESGGTGVGYLFTPASGLERAWRFGGRSRAITGWNRL